MTKFALICLLGCLLVASSSVSECGMQPWAHTDVSQNLFLHKPQSSAKIKRWSSDGWCSSLSCFLSFGAWPTYPFFCGHAFGHSCNCVMQLLLLLLLLLTGSNSVGAVMGGWLPFVFFRPGSLWEGSAWVIGVIRVSEWVSECFSSPFHNLEYEGWISFRCRIWMSTAMVAGSSGLSAHACWVVGVGVEVIGFLTNIPSSDC